MFFLELLSSENMKHHTATVSLQSDSSYKNATGLLGPSTSLKASRKADNKLGDLAYTGCTIQEFILAYTHERLRYTKESER
jgi:hypothetical protein